MKKGKTIVIDEVEYRVENMTQQQQALLGHIVYSDRKIATLMTNLERLQVGRDSFMKMLKEALETKDNEK